MQETKGLEIGAVVMTSGFCVDYNLDRMIFYSGAKPYRVLLEFDTESMCYPMEAICGNFLEMALDAMLEEVNAFFDVISRALEATPQCFPFNQDQLVERQTEILERIYQQRKQLSMLWFQPITEAQRAELSA